MGRFKTNIFLMTWSPEYNVEENEAVSTSTSSTPPHEVVIDYIKSRAKKWALVYEEAEKIHVHMAFQWYREYDSDYTAIAQEKGKAKWWFSWKKMHAELVPPALDVKPMLDLMGAVGYVGKEGDIKDMKGVTAGYIDQAVNEYKYFQDRKQMDKFTEQFKVITKARYDLQVGTIMGHTGCSEEDAEVEMVRRYYTYEGATNTRELVAKMYRIKNGDPE